MNATVASTSGVRLAVKVFEPPFRAVGCVGSDGSGGDEGGEGGEGGDGSAPTSATPIRHVFVFVHPWGLLGGSWYNTQGLATECAARGATGVCFNLRGVRPSTGRGSLCGHAEVHDVVAVVNWAHRQWCGGDGGDGGNDDDTSVRQSCKLWIVAQSAGSTTAGSALFKLDRGVCAGICYIGYTFGCATSVLFGRHYKHALRLPEPDRQRSIFISGTNDCFTTADLFEQRPLVVPAGAVPSRG